MNQLTIPLIDTLIPFVPEDIAVSSDGHTRMCRITYDDVKQTWVIASRLNAQTGRWVPLNKQRRIGLMAFLNDAPLSSDTHIRVSAIKKSGRAVWADPIEHWG